MFVCKPESDARNKKNSPPGLASELKELVERIEDELNKPCIPFCVPCCIPACPVAASPEPPGHAPCIPILPQENVKSVKAKPAPPPSPPDIMVCYKSNVKSNKGANRRVRKNRAKSRELRAGILYRGCDCEKLNGLQDDCRRTGCQGSPECLTKPDPICGPSEFSNGKHLGKSLLKDVVDSETGEITTQYNCYPATLTKI